MSITHLLLCLAFASSIPVGQMLFKLAAGSIARGSDGFIINAASSPAVWAAFGWYGLSSVLWLYILMAVPLSRAYPFALLGAALVPLLSWLVFHERITPAYVAGGAIVLLGLYVSVAQPIFTSVPVERR